MAKGCWGIESQMTASNEIGNKCVGCGARIGDVGLSEQRSAQPTRWARDHCHFGGQMISEFDARQVRKMKLQLAAFRRGELSLSGFIGDMDFLLNAVEDIPLDWKQRVH